MTDDFNENFKYVVYATGNNGDGYVQEIGRYDDLDEIDIRVGLFDKDTVINIHKDYEIED